MESEMGDVRPLINEAYESSINDVMTDLNYVVGEFNKKANEMKNSDKWKNSEFLRGNSFTWKKVPNIPNQYHLFFGPKLLSTNEGMYIPYQKGQNSKVYENYLMSGLQSVIDNLINTGLKLDVRNELFKTINSAKKNLNGVIARNYDQREKSHNVSK